jgi:hypothetical protein
VVSAAIFEEMEKMLSCAFSSSTGSAPLSSPKACEGNTLMIFEGFRVLTLKGPQRKLKDAKKAPSLQASTSKLETKHTTNANYSYL